MNMRTLWNLTKRNMLMYVKDRAAVFFSLLSALIIIGLYAVFLAEININELQKVVPAARRDLAYLVNSWVMAGLIVVNATTVTLGVLGIMIDDEVEKRLPSFLVSPISRSKLTLGYVLAAFIIGNILCVLTLALAQVYIVLAGGAWLAPAQILQALGLILLNVFSSTCLVFFIASLIRSRNAFAIASTLIGTLIGFVAGIYLPIGLLPPAVQDFIKCVPFFYGASLMRGVFMANPVALVFRGAPDGAAAGYLETMGARVVWHGTVVPDTVKIGIVLLSGVVMLVLSAVVMRKKRTAGC